MAAAVKAVAAWAEGKEKSFSQMSAAIFNMPNSFLSLQVIPIRVTLGRFFFIKDCLFPKDSLYYIIKDVILTESRLFFDKFFK